MRRVFPLTYKMRIARWLLPWCAEILTRMRYTRRRSMWLDRLQVMSRGGDEHE